jgi:hypothetical protein
MPPPLTAEASASDLLTYHYARPVAAPRPYPFVNHRTLAEIDAEAAANRSVPYTPHRPADMR